ncbi:hypothetical protein [Bacillus sp. UNCCL81]|nr:hypothetical protein [Bacillus sp. UNCCL81]SFC52726.1 hypothetical protein SAMN02799633_01099 [Bacillus sp. UNCCL81]
MSKSDCDMYIEWLTIWSEYSKEYWIRQSDEIVRINYQRHLEELVLS